MLGRRLALPLFFLCAALLVQPCAATPFQWEFTGSLNTARYYHTATLLSDGRVLVAGGAATGAQTFPYPALASAELYDPATGNWTFTGNLNAGRLLHTATLLLNGNVLVAGGWSEDHPHNGIMSSAELYDPATGNWTRTSGMNVGRAAHTATLLFDGRVLVVGASRGFPNSAELYDPATGTWSFTGSTTTARSVPHGDVAAQRQGAGGRRDAIAWHISPARNCTIQRRELGRLPAASYWLARTTRRRCWPTARCW